MAVRGTWNCPLECRRNSIASLSTRLGCDREKNDRFRSNDNHRYISIHLEGYRPPSLSDRDLSPRVLYFASFCRTDLPFFHHRHVPRTSKPPPSFSAVSNVWTCILSDTTLRRERCLFIKIVQRSFLPRNIHSPIVCRRRRPLKSTSSSRNFWKLANWSRMYHHWEHRYRESDRESDQRVTADKGAKRLTRSSEVQDTGTRIDPGRATGAVEATGAYRKMLCR